jgi:malonyl CoA-acyl carrier protein transacylase/phosphopantetheinyl transferase
VGVVVLKRREEAERDGDRIYAVIKGVGTSSDGRGLGPFAPRAEGEELAISRAYKAAGIPPQSVGLIEAHGTAMPVGDLAEIQALTRVFGPRKGSFPTCAIGTVKSMIGHAMPAAGIAGLIKTALALHYKVLPPTLHCDTPNPKFELEKTPFYINTETRPWIHGAQDAPRRAGVSAFGFGGVNAHVILEEHPGSADGEVPCLPLHWETEVLIVQGTSRQELIEQALRLERWLESAPTAQLKDLAYTMNTDLRDGSLRLAIVASSPEDLRQKLVQARGRLADPACRQMKDVRGLYFFEESLLNGGKLAFLFPGEGGQYPNMLKDLCLHFPEVRAAFDDCDRIFQKKGGALLPSQCIFPIQGSSDEERLEAEKRLWEMGGALEAILTANRAMCTLLRHIEIRPDMFLGHSSGEYSALVAAGVMGSGAVLHDCGAALSAGSDRLTAEGMVPAAALAAIGADRASVTAMLQQIDEPLHIAMDNCPHQVVIAGREEAVEAAIEQLRAMGVVCQRLPFNRAYHTPLFSAAAQPLREFLGTFHLSPPEIDVYSCLTMAPYPRDPQQIKEQMAELWSRPVEFTGSVEALYDAGTRVFVEVGPRGNVAAFVDDILRGRPHLAIACDVPLRSSITQLNHVVGVLAAQGVSMRLDYLYGRRSPRRLALDESASTLDRAARPPSSVVLPLDLPAMQISPERAKTLTLRSTAAAGNVASPPAGQGGARLPEVPAEPGRFSAVGTALDQTARPPVTPRHVGPARPSLDMASLVMQDHLQTMERFLAVEQQIMEVFLDGSGEDPAPEAVGSPSVADAPPLPFVGTITAFTPGREVVIRRRLDPDEDIFLLDHSFGCRGSEVSDVDRTLQNLPVMPFTMLMEMMSEAASLLAPGKVLTGLRQIEARQWVEVDSPTTLEITARKRATGDEVDVQIWNLGSAAVEARTEIPTVEGTVIFSDAYSPPPAIVSLSLKSERPCRYSATQMYEEKRQFHGPQFQGVMSLDSVGENGILTQLQVLPRTDLFRSTTAPRLLTDPVLLDSAAQNIGTWALECLDTGYVVFPFRLSALEIYGPMPPVSQRVRLELEVHQVTPRQVSVTMSLFGQEGRVVVRLVNWQDIRFFWPKELYDFCRFPKQYLLSTPWEVPVIRLSAREGFVCQRIDVTAEHTRTIAIHTIVRNLLSQAERQQWRNLKGRDIRRTEWLFGRAAAKDAVRRLLKEHDGKAIFPTDIEICQDADGRPFASLLGMSESKIVPSISIAHSDGLAVAIAGYCSEGQGLGIDIERVQSRKEGFQEIAFSKDELGLLDAFSGSARDEWVTRFWCAKEAVAKGLGKGLVEGPRSLQVRSLDVATGRVEVILGEGLTRAYPDLAGALLAVYTAREDDWVVASTLCERS